MVNKYNFLCRKGSKFNQIICAIMINLSSMSYGAALGWMSPMTLLLQSPESPRGDPLTDQEVSWMASASYLTSIPSNFFFAYIADRWGRKKSLMFCSAQFLCCWLVKLSSTSTWALVVARALVGTGMGGAYVIIPLYVKEISEDSIRGTLGSLMILSQTIGTLLLYIFGDMFGYRTILLICLTIPAVHITFFLLMPESPAFLVKQGDAIEATRALSWLRCSHDGDSAIQLELDMLKKELEREQDNNKCSLKAILTDKIIFRAFRISMVLSLAREICGVVPVLNFAGDIFRMASEGGRGVPLSPNQQTMLLGVVQVLGSAVASSLVEKAGRKLLLILTTTLFSIGLCGLSSWFLLRTLGVQAPDWIPIISLWLCIFCNGCGLQPVSIIIVSELFAFQHRSTVTAIASALGSFADFTQILFFKPLASIIGIHPIFYGFAAICLVHAIYVTLVVPETKMKNLEQVYYELKTEKEKEEDLKTFKVIKIQEDSSV